MSILDIPIVPHGFNMQSYGLGLNHTSSLFRQSLPLLGSSHESGFLPKTAGGYLLFSFVMCLFTSIVSGIISRYASKSYRELSAVDRKTWCIGCVRGIAGVVLTVMAVPIYYCEVMHSDVAFATTDYSRIMMAVLVGFFAFELASLCWVAVFYNYKNVPLWIHHVLGLAFVGSVMYYESLHFFALTSCVQELSAPITSISWMMSKCKKQKTWAFIANHASLVFVWIFVRIGNDLHRLYYIAQDYERVLFQAPILPLATFLAGTIVLTFLLNPLWLKMKGKQLKKAIRIKLEEGQDGLCTKHD